MVYFKSAVAGITSVILAALIGYLVLIGYLSLRHRTYPWQFSFEISPRAPAKTTFSDIGLALVPLLIFAVGFAWEYRRASRQVGG